MELSETEIEDELLKLLEKSVELSCGNEKKIGVVFSAGLDSTVIAFLAQRFSDVKAYAVGTENSEDIEGVRKLKDFAEFDIKTIGIDIEKVRKILPVVLQMIDKKDDPIQVSCAIPIYLASKEATKSNLAIMLSGQGSDELFGGYNRYLVQTNDYRKLSAVLEDDVKNAYADNLNRDSVICAANGIELRFPFMDKELVKFALEIPAELKVKEVEDKEFSCIDIIDGKKFIRKYVLRKIAKKIGIPEVVINRPKKALQYGSHSMKILERITREEGFKSDVRSYIEALAKNL